MGLFTSGSSCVSASNSALLASKSFILPATLSTEAKSSQAAVDDLQKAFEDVKRFIGSLQTTISNVALVPFDEAVSPRVSRIEGEISGKVRRFDLTFSVRSGIPADLNYWERLKLVAKVYDNFSELARILQERKGPVLLLHQARLDQQTHEEADPGFSNSSTAPA